MSLESSWGLVRVCLFFGFVFAVPAFFLVWRRIKLKKDCTAQADGTVTDSVRHVSGSRKRERSSTYRATFQYTVNGVEYAGSVKTIMTKYSVGENIAVHYDPSNPKRNYGGKLWVFWEAWSAGLTFLGAFFLILAIWILIVEIPAAMK